MLASGTITLSEREETKAREIDLKGSTISTNSMCCIDVVRVVMVYEEYYTSIHPSVANYCTIVKHRMQPWQLFPLSNVNSGAVETIRVIQMESSLVNY